MGFFTKKRRISLAEFCNDFYENVFINPKIGGKAFPEVFAQSILSQLIKVNTGFINVDQEAFLNEILKIRFELFGLAFYYSFGEEKSIENSIFTKQYLEQRKLNSIWDESVIYNHQIAEGATFGLRAKGKDGEMKIIQINNLRMNLCNKYFEKYVDPQCVARSVNRFWTNEAWKIKYIQYCLTLTLCEKLQVVSNKEAEFCFAEIFTGIFNGAFEVMGNVKLV
jgi:hypothetical protein